MLVSVLVTVAAAYVAVHDVDPADVRRSLGDAEVVWLIPALVVLMASIWLRAVRWRSLYERGRRPPLRTVTGALVVGYFFNNVLPLRAGEVARVVALHRRAGTSRAETAGTVVIERIFDVVSLVLLLLLALPWLPAVGWVSAAGVLAGVLIGGLAITVGVLVAFGERPLRFVLGPVVRSGLSSAQRAERAAENLATGLTAIRDVRVAAAAFAWTTLSWVVMAMSFWLVVLAFDLAVGPLAAMLVLIAIGLAMVLPSSPGAVGVFEAATITALGAYGVDDAVALSYALVLHAVNLVLYLAAGAAVLAYYARGSGLSWMRRIR